MPKISVIIPVYNVAPYLNRCVDSVLSQTFRDFELILVDDGSKDNSGVFCDAYAQADARVRVIHQENSGVSAARNAGLDAASGEWISFIDSDDWVDTDYLSYLYDLATKHNADMATGTIRRCENDVVTPYAPLPENSPGIIPVALEDAEFQFSQWYSFIGLACKIIRRNLIEDNKLRFRHDLTNGEDLVFYTEIMLHTHRCVSSEKALYNYFQHAESASHSAGFSQWCSFSYAWFLTSEMLCHVWDSYRCAMSHLLWDSHKTVWIACENPVRPTHEQVRFLQRAFREARKYRHSLAKGIKFELLYLLLEYNLPLYLKLMRKKNETAT